MDANGLNYRLTASDKILVVADAKGRLVCSTPLQNVTVLFYCEKNAVGAGQLILSVSGRPKPIIESFREKGRAEFTGLYQFLAQHCLVLNLPYLQAVQYVQPQAGPSKAAPAAGHAASPPAPPVPPAVPNPDAKPPLWARIGATKKKETRCVCLNCGHHWAYGEFDQQKQNLNIRGTRLSALSLNPGMAGYFANNLKDLNQCPQCGSRKIQKKAAAYWVDGKGNAIT